MSQSHTVEQGETLSEIAYRYGYAKPEDIYHHPDNASLREKRKDWQVLHPGDRIVLPDIDPRREKCSDGEKHRFRRSEPKKLLKLKLHDHREPEKFKDVPYTLTIQSGGNDEFSGQLDGDGVLTQKVPATAKEAMLTLELAADDGGGNSDDGDGGGEGGVKGWTLHLFIDHLDPVDEVTGYQARLLNLGYDCGALDGIFGPRTEDALRHFQARHGLDVNGKADEKTQQALAKDYGS